MFSPYNIPDQIMSDLTTHLISPVSSQTSIPSPLYPTNSTSTATQTSPLTSFLMLHHHNLEAPAQNRAITCALTIALGYFMGGFIPLLPYLFVARTQVMEALVASIVIMIVALFVFGYCKTCFVSGWKGRTSVIGGMKGGGEMVVVGGLAAGCAMGLVRAFNAFM